MQQRWGISMRCLYKTRLGDVLDGDNYEASQTGHQYGDYRDMVTVEAVI